MSIHVIKRTTNPVAAPDKENVHWLNTTTKQFWYSVGTSSVADWVEEGQSGVTDHTALSNIGTNTHAQIDTHIADTANPHAVTKTQVGLGNVDNTSDADKPVSTATQTALDNLDHVDLANIGTNTHAQIDTHISDTLNPHAVTQTQVGLGNVDNTSDADKPISDLTQTALDNKQDTISINNNQMIYQNNSGDIAGVDSFYIEPNLLGMNFTNTFAPDNDSNTSTLNNFQVNTTAQQASLDDGLIVQNINISSDDGGLGFALGGNTRAFLFLNNNLSHLGAGDLGEVAFMSNYFNIGNDVDSIDLDGFSYNYGFGDINEQVTIIGPMQGYGFQPTFANNTSVDNTDGYLSAFYDSVNAPNTDFASYTSFQASPQLGGIQNNRNFSGLNINPNITTLTGNAGVIGVNVNGTFGTFGASGYFQGLNIDPTITSVPNATGIQVDMSNVTGTNVKAMDITGDVSINGSLSFSGGLSIGQLDAFYGSNPVNGGGVPTSLHSLITSMTALNGVTVANADTIGVNTAMLVTLEEDSVTTSGPFGLGLTSLALPCVVITEPNSSLDNMSGIGAAINLDASSTGGTIDTIKIARSVIVPNGVTTVNNVRGFQYDAPFGQAGTVNHGFYTAIDCDNYFMGGLVVGELTEVRTNSSVGIEISSETKALLNSRMTSTQRDALTAVNGMQIYNTTTDKLQVRAAGSWVDLH